MYPNYSGDHENDQIHHNSITDPSNTPDDFERFPYTPEGDVDINELVNRSYYQPQDASPFDAVPPPPPSVATPPDQKVSPDMTAPPDQEVPPDMKVPPDIVVPEGTGEAPSAIPLSRDDDFGERIEVIPTGVRRYMSGHTPHYWLDTYVTHSRKIAPRSFDLLHELLGIWCLSALTGGRAHGFVTTEWRKTAIMGCAIATSSVYTKSRTVRVAKDLLDQTPSFWRLLANKTTPQALISQMCNDKEAFEIVLKIDFEKGKGDEADQDKIDKLYTELENKRLNMGARFGHEGQRAWHISEFGSKILRPMLDGSGPMTDFEDLFRDINESKIYKYETRSHGTEEIANPYLAVISDTTPDDLRPYAKEGSRLWTNGFFPRFILVTPRQDEKPVLVMGDPNYCEGKDIFDQTVKKLVDPLLDLDERLPRRHNYWEKHPKLELIWPSELHEKLYQYELFARTWCSKSEDLTATIQRLAVEMCPKVAMLLCLIDGHTTVLERHLWRAIEFTERVRHATEQLYHSLTQNPLGERDSQQAKLEEKVLSIIKKYHNKHGKWPTFAQIHRNSGRNKYRISHEKLLKTLDILQDAKVIVKQTNTGKSSSFMLIKRD